MGVDTEILNGVISKFITFFKQRSPLKQDIIVSILKLCICELWSKVDLYKSLVALCIFSALYPTHANRVT